MADDLQDNWRRAFEDLGEEPVRKRVEKHVWLEPGKEKLARQWLELRGTALAREANDLAKEANKVATEANDIARTNNIVAALALIGAVIAIGISVLGLFLKMG